MAARPVKLGRMGRSRRGTNISADNGSTLPAASSSVGLQVARGRWHNRIPCRNVPGSGNMTVMRLAFYTYSYTDRLNLSVPECFARIAKTGYSGIDESSTFGNAVNSTSVSAERRQLIREAARQHKLRV